MNVKELKRLRNDIDSLIQKLIVVEQNKCEHRYKDLLKDDELCDILTNRYYRYNECENCGLVIKEEKPYSCQSVASRILKESIKECDHDWEDILWCNPNLHILYKKYFMCKKCNKTNTEPFFT